MLSFEELAAGLRAWAEGDRVYTAAVELLIGHETWLRRGDFRAACIDGDSEMARIRWDDARKFTDAVPPCSTTELAILRLAVAIGSDDYRLASMGRANTGLITQAFATALGQTLEGLIPEPGHTHPDFIPGTPETCGACAREAEDEGRRRT